jgi:hypothetical protein
MFAQRVTINYADGTSTEEVLTQWSLSQWAIHATQKGWKFDMQAPGLLSVTMLRYQAWCTVHRASKTRPNFDVWDLSVDEVTPINEVEAEVPTLTALSGT